MADVMDRLYSDLDALCQKRLEGITIADVAAALIQRSQGKKFGCPEVCENQTRGWRYLWDLQLKLGFPELPYSCKAC